VSVPKAVSNSESLCRRIDARCRMPARARTPFVRPDGTRYLSALKWRRALAVS
jgi:hypothetical protein